MTKTFSIIEENLKLVDACVELRDARIPISSANPKIDEIIHDKPRVLLLNKADLADPHCTDRWIEYFKKQGIQAIAVEAANSRGMAQMQKALYNATQTKRIRLAAKGIKAFTARAMILGIPNVGKSTLINTLNKGKVAKTGDKAGVTRGKQWISVAKDLELMDLPGVLWPKIEDQTSAKYLAFTGCINDDAIDKQQLELELACYLWDSHQDALTERYKLDVNIEITDNKGVDILAAIAKKRGMLLSGGRVDINRAGEMLLYEFRAGKVGKITLDIVEQ